MDICEASAFGNEKINRHPWELTRIKVVKDILEPICNGKESIHILDVGCGDVYVAQQLSQHFPQAIFHCIDIAFTNEIKDSLINRISNVPISLYSSLEELKTTNTVKKVDVILLLDVIEHIENDVDFMRNLNMSGFLDKETRIVITVPAFQSLFSNHDVYLKHYRRYTIELLNKNLKSAGFSVVKNGYFFISLLGLRIIQKLLQGKNKQIDTEKGIGEYRSKGIFDILLIAILYADYLFGKFFRIFKINIPGLSCFAICQQQS